MQEPVAYFRGEFLPASQAAVAVIDLGFMQGVTVAEQLRTFGGELFRLDEHLDRLARSLAIVGIEPELSREQFVQISAELVARNYPALPTGSDLGLALFVTPGLNPAFARAGYGFPSPAGSPPKATVGLHTFALPFHTWASKYEHGESLRVTAVEQIPAACWPPELKCRSRMHYYLADRAANALEPGARALLLDGRGFVTESSTANLLIYNRSEGLISPPKATILPGVTVAAVVELAGKMGIPCSERNLTVEDVATAEEVLLCSTSPCVWAVTKLNGKAIGSGQPGEICRRLQRAWSEMVGVDIVAQAREFGTDYPTIPTRS